MQYGEAHNSKSLYVRQRARLFLGNHSCQYDFSTISEVVMAGNHTFVPARSAVCDRSDGLLVPSSGSAEGRSLFALLGVFHRPEGMRPGKTPNKLRIFSNIPLLGCG
jgi:hypothetical protein